jgi:phthiocerol/phenolphthiocerol synthesis type-I polyketide synthase D
MTQQAKKARGGLIGKLFGGPAPQGPVTAAAIQTWLVNRLAAHLEIPPEEVDLNMPFADYGLDSRTAVALAGELEELVGEEVPHTLVWDYPTITAIVRYLAGGPAEAGPDQAPAVEARP